MWGDALAREANPPPQVSLNLWRDQLKLLEFRSAKAWEDIAPVNVPFLQAIVFGREDALHGNGIKLNKDRMATAAGPEAINSPAGPGRLAFKLFVKADVLMWSPENFLRTVGIPCTTAGVLKILGGSTRVCCLPALPSRSPRPPDHWHGRSRRGPRL